MAATTEVLAAGRAATDTVLSARMVVTVPTLVGDLGARDPGLLALGLHGGVAALALIALGVVGLLAHGEPVPLGLLGLDARLLRPPHRLSPPLSPAPPLLPWLTASKSLPPLRARQLLDLPLQLVLLVLHPLSVFLALVWVSELVSLPC